MLTVQYGLVSLPYPVSSGRVHQCAGLDGQDQSDHD